MSYPGGQRTYDDEMQRVLASLLGRGWLTARDIRAADTQYGWLLRRGFIERENTRAPGDGRVPRYRYRITHRGEQRLAQSEEAQP